MRLQKKCRCIWRNKRQLAGLAFLLPGLAGVGIFVFLPFLDVIRRSFYTSLTGEYVGGRNYEAVLHNQAFGLAVRNTALFVAVSLPLLLLLGFAVALAIYQIHGLEWMKTLYLLPMAIPAAATAFVWKLLFAGQGLLNGLLGTDIAFLEGQEVFWVLVGTYVWKNLGYTVILWLASLKAVPLEQLEAARVDGAGYGRRLWYVLLPGVRGGGYTISLLSFLNAFKAFREVYLINGAYPPEPVYMLQHVFQNWYAYLELDKMTAAAVCSALVLGSVAIGLKRLLEDGERDTAGIRRHKNRKIIRSNKLTE